MSSLLARTERLLRWSEKYMKTDMVYLAKGGFWLTLGQIVSVATGLLLVIAFANLLPKDVYGNYKFILSLAGIISAFTLTGMDVAVTQAVARGADGAFRTGFRVQLKWSLLILLAALFGAVYYEIQGNRITAISLLIVGACAPIIESCSLSGAYLNGKKDFRASAFYGIFRNLVPMTALIVTMAYTQSLLLIVLAYFLSHALSSSLVYLHVLKTYAPARTADDSNISYSKHVSFLNITSIIISYIDKILVFHFLGAVQLAIYGIAFSLPGQMKVVTKTINTLAFPKMSSAPLSAIRETIYQKAFRLFLVFAVVVVAYILAAPFIFRLMFPQYLEAVPLSQLFALGYLFSPVILFSQAFLAQKRKKEIYVNKIAAACIRVTLLLTLLPAFGIWGAGFAYVLGNAASFVITIVLFQRLRE